jgi:hypothetical protein
MTVERMELTNFHLGRRQKQVLKERAQANGTNVAEELRNAVDAYLAGVTHEQMELLDAATKHAAGAIAEMNAMLDATNRRADRIFEELEKLRGGRPVGAEAASAAAPRRVRRASH